MKSNYKRLGKYIQEVNNRDTDKKVELLLGVSIQKVFMPSIANTIGTDMSTYKIIKRNQFAYGPVTSRNGDKISIALMQEADEAIVSQAYVPFEITDTKELNPEYLMMWFQRPEFDRYARFMSHGSAREVFGWEEMCNVMIPVPHPNKQKEIVKEYNTIINRIALNNQLIKKLEETAQSIYRQWFVEFEFPDEEGNPYKSSGGKMELNKDIERQIPKEWVVKRLADFCDVKGGKRLPKGEELNDDKNGNPYIKVADMSNSKFIVLNNKFQHVENQVRKIISRYIVSSGDVIISVVGTIGLVNIVHETLDKANLTENCMKLTNIKQINADFLYHFLFSTVGQQIIETKTVGGVQGKLPMYNIKSIPIIYPTEKLLNKFEQIIAGMNSSLKNHTSQNTKLSVLKDLLLSKLATIEN